MPGIAEKPLAWTELEARFARAMSQNADLVEQNERLEHVILQLQSENDTIGLWQIDPWSDIVDVEQAELADFDREQSVNKF